MAAAEIQVINQSNLQKIESFLTDSAYREAIENSATFNTRLCIERRLRMPFLDPQTGVAQTHCNLFMHRRQRMPGFKEGQLYTYPAARWRKAKRQYLSINRGGWGDIGCGVGSGIEEDGIGVGGTGGMGGRDGPDGGVEPHDTDSKDSHHKDDTSKDWFYDDMAMEELDTFEEPEPESDDDYYEESYSARKRRLDKEKGGDKGGDKSTPGGGRGGRKGRGSANVDSDVVSTPKGRGRGGGRGRKKALQQTLPYEVPGDAEKPYGCERGRGGVGSTAANTSVAQTPAATPAPPTHAAAPSSTPAAPAAAASSSPARTASPSSPKPSSGETNKASPYCDFCLGDQHCNKKSGVPEELVSCSDCGRSGKAVLPNGRETPVSHTYSAEDFDKFVSQTRMLEPSCNNSYPLVIPPQSPKPGRRSSRRGEGRPRKRYS